MGAKSGDASTYQNINLQVWVTKSSSPLTETNRLTAQIRLSNDSLITLQVPDPIDGDYRNRWLHVLLFRSITAPQGWVLMFGRTGQGFGSFPDGEADEFGTSLENTGYKYAVGSSLYLASFLGLANNDDPANSQHITINDGASYGPFPGSIGRGTNGVVSELRFWRLTPYPSGFGGSYFPAAELRNQFVTGAEYPSLLNCWRLNGETGVLSDDSWQDVGVLRQGISTNGTAFVWGYPEHPIPPDAIGEIKELDTGFFTVAGAAAELPLDADKPLAVEDSDAAALVTADLSSTDILSADSSGSSSGVSAVLDNLRNYLLPDAGGAGEADSFQLNRIIGSLVLEDGAGGGNALAALGSRIDMGQVAPDGESDAAALLVAILTYELPSADSGSSATADLRDGFIGLAPYSSDAGSGASGVVLVSVKAVQPVVIDRIVGQSIRNEFYMVREVVSAANGAIGEGEAAALDIGTQQTLQIAPGTGGSGAALEIPLESARNYLVEPTGGDAAATVGFFNSARLIPDVTNRSSADSAASFDYIAGFDCGLIPGSGDADVFELSAINELRTGVTGGAGLAEVYEIVHIVNMLIPESDSLGGASGSYLLRDLGFECQLTERSSSFGTRFVLGSAFFVIPDSGESYTLAYAELHAVLPLEGDYLLPEAGAVAALGLSLALYPDPLLLPESGTLELPSSVARYFEFGPVGGRLEHNFVQENWVHYLIPEDTGGSAEAYLIPGLHRDVTYVPFPGDTGGALVGDDLILTVNTEQFLIPEQGNPAGGGAIEYWEIPRFFYARPTGSTSRILEYGVVRTVQPSEPIYANCVSDEVG